MFVGHYKEYKSGESNVLDLQCINKNARSDAEVTVYSMYKGTSARARATHHSFHG